MSFCIKEDRYAEEEVQAGGDRRQAKPSRCAGLTGIEHGGRDVSDRGQGGGLRDELLNGEIFCTLREAKIIIESWRRHYNAVRPHASIGYKPPATEVFVPAFAAWPASLRRPDSPATLAQSPPLS
jgi:transposase InsO family protein